MDNYSIHEKLVDRFCVLEKGLATNIISSTIVLLYGNRLLNQDEKIAILANHKAKFIPNFTGRITLFDIGYVFKEYGDYNAGLQKKHGILEKNPTKGVANSRNGNDCVDWYIVVYVDGQVYSITYSHTICYCEQTRIGANLRRGGCEGGGGGGTPTVGYLNGPPPGVKALAVFTDPCDYVSDMLSRSNSTYPPRETFGVLTVDGHYLVTQQLDEFGGTVAGMHRDKTTGQGLYVWPVTQEIGTPPYAGSRKILAENVECWAVPISAVIHTHPTNSTNNVSTPDSSLASKLPSTRFYKINSAGNVSLYTSVTPTYSYPSGCSTLE